MLGPSDILGSPADFPDLRLFKRVPWAIKALFCRLCEPPTKIGRALRKGITRFVTNPRLNGERMTARVLNTNAQKARAVADLVAAIDTTEDDEHGRGVPRDAGPLRSSQSRGYLLQLSVACTLGGVLLGAVDAFVWTRSWILRQKDHNSRPPHLKESRKWGQSIARTEKRLRKQGFLGRLFFVADSEADDYNLLATQQAKKRLLIVRRDLSRRRFVPAAKPLFDKRGMLKTQWIPVEDKLNAIAYRGSYDVDVDSRHTDRARGLTHRVRRATVSFRYCRVMLKPPKLYRGPARSGLSLWLVEAKERNPPPGVEPLHWQLFSLLSVISDEDALMVIQIYKLRWKCEDYIKITKSGCRLEDQHVDKLASFKRLLALSLAAANQLAQIVAASREETPRQLDGVLDPPTIQALRDAADYHHVAVPENPTVSEGLLVIGKIGGFEWCKGRVLGWLVLTRGWVRVLEHQAIVARDRERRERLP